MSLPPQVQTLVDQIVSVMGLHPFHVSGLEINMDREGLVQDVKPKIIYRREKEIDKAENRAHS